MLSFVPKLKLGNAINGFNKLLTVAKIVGHSSMKTLMTSYTGFIKLA